MMPLKELASKLCQNREKYCRFCFEGSRFKTSQNPPNVFRVVDSGLSASIAFVFDKPNDNTRLKNTECIPITIYDDRSGNHNLLRRSPSHLNLINLCRMLNLIPPNSTSLAIPNIHVTNAVKCDVCSDTGQTGRIDINEKQARACRELFLVNELIAVKARSIIFFGNNSQRYTLNGTTPLWSISDAYIKNTKYSIMRVPHTSPTSFNTHGRNGQEYIKAFNELCKYANINIKLPNINR